MQSNWTIWLISLITENYKTTVFENTFYALFYQNGAKLSEQFVWWSKCPKENIPTLRHYGTSGRDLLLITLRKVRKFEKRQSITDGGYVSGRRYSDRNSATTNRPRKLWTQNFWNFSEKKCGLLNSTCTSWRIDNSATKNMASISCLYHIPTSWIRFISFIQKRNRSHQIS